MPRYFFHIEDGVAVHDDEGTELKDLAVAKCEAVKVAGQMICDSAGAFWDKEEWRLTATDEDGLTLFCLHFVGVEAPAAGGFPDPNLISARPVNP
ncbi:MAG: hypothetical protein QOJ27_2391 [Sphingomonadales bacterium]|jgi:hypothetical protein|nr:hypothetical protein [Sphingomonadales bacterium]